MKSVLPALSVSAHGLEYLVLESRDNQGKHAAPSTFLSYSDGSDVGDCGPESRPSKSEETKV